jgi:hypothetical protein
VLEANVRPSVERGTEFPLAAALAGLSPADLLDLIIASAARRHGIPPARLEASRSEQSRMEGA